MLFSALRWFSPSSGSSKIGSASQSRHSLLFYDWSLSVIPSSDWLLIATSLPWSWLTLLTQQWVHHRHHAPTFTRVLTLGSWAGLHLSSNTGYINNHLHPHSVLQSSGQPLHRGCHYLLAMRRAEKTKVKLCPKNTELSYVVSIKFKDMVFKRIYKHEQLTKVTWRLFFLTFYDTLCNYSNPHPLTFEPSQHPGDWRKTSLKSSDFNGGRQ